MKNMLKKLRRLLAGGALALAACDDPIDKDPNANANPAVLDVYFTDSLAFDGSSGLSENDPVTFQHLVEGTLPNIPATNAVFPFTHPRLIFNKLMNGDTLELAEKERTYTAGRRELGYCRQPATPGVVLSVGSTPIPTLRVCYSPSDKLVTVQPGVETTNDNGTPADASDDFIEVSASTNFLNYGETYTIGLTPAAKDKRGKSIDNYSQQFVVRQFEVLAVDDGEGHGAYMNEAWGGFSISAEDAALPIGRSGLAALRLVFSGPIAALTDADGNVTSDPASVLNAPGVLTDADGNEITALDSNGDTVRFLFTQTDPLEGFVAADPRIMYALHPDYLAGGEAGGFSPGTYRLTLPATFADNGSVTGNPVAIGEALTIEFSVVEPSR